MKALVLALLVAAAPLKPVAAKPLPFAELVNITVTQSYTVCDEAASGMDFTTPDGKMYRVFGTATRFVLVDFSTEWVWFGAVVEGKMVLEESMALSEARQRYANPCIKLIGIGVTK